MTPIFLAGPIVLEIATVPVAVQILPEGCVPRASLRHHDLCRAQGPPEEGTEAETGGLEAVDG